MAKYKVIYRKQEVNSGSIVKFDVPASNIRSLSKFLNAFVKKNNKNFYIMAVLLLDEKDDIKSSVKFLQSEFASQRWLTGWKERLLANAIEKYGEDLKWNSGLKKINLAVVEK